MIFEKKLHLYDKIQVKNIKTFKMTGSVQTQTQSQSPTQSQSRTYTFSSHRDLSTKQWPIIVKSISVILCILCIIFIDDPANSFRIRLFVSPRFFCLCYGTYVTYMIYSTVYLVGKLIGDEWPWKTMIILSSIATILFLICGIVLLRGYTNIRWRTYWPLLEAEDRGSSGPMTVWLLLVAGILSVVTAVVHLIDAILLFWLGKR